MSLPSLPSLGRARQERTVGSIALASILTLTMATATVADSSQTKLLRVAPEGVAITATHVAVKHQNIAVTWQEDHGPNDLDKFSFVRWSADGGQTWASKVALDSGSPTSSAAVDICAGYVWATSRFPAEGGTWSLGLDARQVNGPGYAWGTFDPDPAADGDVLNANVACVGGRRLAAIWTDVSTSPPHVKVAMRPLWPCTAGCEPRTWYSFDLGPGDHDASPDIVATNGAVYAAWMADATMHLKRFSMASDEAATVTAHPTQILPEGTSGGNWLGAHGRRVVLAYEAAPYGVGETRVIVSTHRGQWFGDPISLPGSRLPMPDVAVRGREAVVESDHGSYRFHSIDGGRTWSQEPSHPLGHQLGAFIDVSGVLQLAEVWDNDSSGVSPQRLRFAIGPP